MPEKCENILKFQNYRKQLQVPFVIHAEFEAQKTWILVNQMIIIHIQNHIKKIHIVDLIIKLYHETMVSWLVVMMINKTKPVQIYLGENALYKFMEKMLNEVKYCKNMIKYKFHKTLKLIKVDEENFKQAKECHICNKKYNDEDKRVRDHDHVTGKYRGCAHESCNLNFKLTDKIPVIFHKYI